MQAATPAVAPVASLQANDPACIVAAENLSSGQSSAVTGVGEGRHDRNAQLTIDDAIAAGTAGIAQSLDAAHRRDPQFSAKAEAAILRHLGLSPRFQCPGEDLTDHCIGLGIVPPDQRAFGGVFQSMSRRGLIRTVGFCERRKGHGTAGGRIWGLVQ